MKVEISDEHMAPHGTNYPNSFMQFGSFGEWRSYMNDGGFYNIITNSTKTKFIGANLRKSIMGNKGPMGYILIGSMQVNIEEKTISIEENIEGSSSWTVTRRDNASTNLRGDIIALARLPD